MITGLRWTMENQNMHPKYVQKTKALVWYWLNNHPAETFHKSPTELHASGAYGESDESPNFDMTIEHRGWKLANGESERIMVEVDPDQWHDVNRAINRWYYALEPIDQLKVMAYFKVVKGKPLDQWQMKYTGQVAPKWDGLVERFISMQLIIIDGDND
jgi:hypothetical protein